MGTVSLMIATFLNPFGFDLLVYKMTELTHDYWNTMYILYSLALALFLLSLPFFRLGKRTIGNILIAIALFLNPFGYDIIVYCITLLTMSYWVTMCIMYILAIIFFGLFLYFNEVNVVKNVRVKTKIILRNYKFNLKNNE